jgi:phage tail-like protein
MADSLYDFVPNVFFDVLFVGMGVGMSGEFTSVSGLGMEFEYETYNEGGRNYPVRFFKNTVPQTLVLEQGTVTTVDPFVAWLLAVNEGVTLMLNGTVTLKDHTGAPKRVWTIIGALPVKYVGPNLDSMRSELAVTRLEFMYNGCV